MFLEGVIHQVEAFAMAAGVDIAAVLVRFVMSDGESIVTRGLKITSPFGTSDWGMVSASGKTEEAIIIREQDVVRVQLELAARSRAIGFAAEQ